MRLHFNFRSWSRLWVGLLLFSMLGGINTLKAQDFTDIGKRKPFVLSGSVGAQASTRLNTQAAYSDPFSYLFNLQLNPVVYGFSMPISVSFADNRFSYSQPFSRFSIQPTYKWITAYIGRTSMEMHPYGLSGHQFDGVGISLQPAGFPLKFMAMYGRLEKARADSVGARENSFQPLSSYKRSGYAFKADFEHKGQKVGVHFFRAADKASSLPAWARKNMAPQANNVVALDFSFTLYKDLYLQGQAGFSHYISDLSAEKTGRNHRHNPSASWSTALKAGLAYKWLNLAYERISPEYRTMGAYYFNQDFENLVLSFAHTFSFVDLRAEIGWQHDDLKASKQNRTDRVVGSAYANFRINENFTTSANYSNFTSYTQSKPIDLTRPDDPFVQDFDTVPFRQISQQAQWVFTFRTSPQARRAQEAGVDFSYQSSRLSVQQDFSDYLYGNLRHSIVLNGDYRLQSALSVSTRLDRRQGQKQPLRYGIGPSVSLSKSFLEKTLLASASCSYYIDMCAKQAESGIWGMRLNLSYTLKKAHHFDLNLSTRLNNAFRDVAAAEATATRKNNFEFQAMVGYRYQFSVDPFARKKNTKKLTDE